MGFKGQYFQNLQGFKGSMFQGYQRSKGFRDSRDRGFPLLTRAFNELGVSKIQGFQGKYIYKIRTRTKHHRPCIVSHFATCPFYGPSMANGIYLIFGNWTNGEAHISREGIRVWEQAVEGPELVIRLKALEGHSKSLASKVFQSRGFRAPKVKGFKTCRDISLVYPQGIKGARGSIFPRLTGFHGLNVSRAPKIQGWQ